METITTTAGPEQAKPHARVRTDLRIGGALLALVIGGNLLWHASEAGVITALAGR